jgi:hypothetical protein
MLKAIFSKRTIESRPIYTILLVLENMAFLVVIVLLSIALYRQDGCIKLELTPAPTTPETITPKPDAI